MAVTGLVCGDCGQTVGAINVAAAEALAREGKQYVCKRCRERRFAGFRRLLRLPVGKPGIRKYLQMEAVNG